MASEIITISSSLKKKHRIKNQFLAIRYPLDNCKNTINMFYEHKLACDSIVAISMIRYYLLLEYQILHFGLTIPSYTT